MRKLRHEGEGKKVTCAIALAAMVMSSLTACGSTSTDTMQESNTVVETVAGEQAEDGKAQANTNGAQDVLENKVQEGNYFGSITAIDGDTITIAVMGGGMPSGEAPEGMSQGERPEGEMPSGEAPAGMSQGERPEGEMPSGEAPDGMSQGEMPNGEMPEGMEKGQMPEGMGNGQMATESMTIEVTDDTVITVDGQTAELSDLQIGDNIMIEMDGESVVAITVVEMEQPQGQPGESTSTESK